MKTKQRVLLALLAAAVLLCAALWAVTRSNAKDDVTDISRYERCNEVPAEILKDCKDLTEE